MTQVWQKRLLAPLRSRSQVSSPLQWTILPLRSNTYPQEPTHNADPVAQHSSRAAGQQLQPYLTDPCIAPQQHPCLPSGYPKGVQDIPLRTPWSITPRSAQFLGGMLPLSPSGGAPRSPALALAPQPRRFVAPPGDPACPAAGGRSLHLNNLMTANDGTVRWRCLVRMLLPKALKKTEGVLNCNGNF